jgi:hypothetical protein
LQEAIEQNWSARALERQISVLYYERSLSSKAPAPVEQEAKEKTRPLQVPARDYLRDPYIFDFLNLPGQSLQETEVEQALIDNLQKFLLELGKGLLSVRFKAPKSGCVSCEQRSKCLRYPERTQTRQAACFIGRTKESKETFTEKMKRKIDSVTGCAIYSLRLAVSELPFAHI